MKNSTYRPSPRAIIGSQVFAEFARLEDVKIPKVLHMIEVDVYLHLRAYEFYECLVSFLLTSYGKADYESKRNILVKKIKQIASRITWECKKPKKKQYYYYLFDSYIHFESDLYRDLLHYSKREGLADTSFVTERFAKKQWKLYKLLARKLSSFMADPWQIEFYDGRVEQLVDNICHKFEEKYREKR